MTIRCPRCGEEIPSDAVKCRHCRGWLNDDINNKNDEDIDSLEGGDDDFYRAVTFAGAYPKNTYPKNASDGDTTPRPGPKISESAERSHTHKAEYIYRRPLLRRQNFRQGQLWSLAVLLIPVAAIGAIVAYALSDKTSDVALYVAVASVAGYMLSKICLLNIVSEYMQNFDVSQNLPGNVRCVQVAMVLIPVMCLLLSTSETGNSEYLFIIFLAGVLFLFYIVFLFLTGLCIYRAKERDYVGGSDALGVFIMISIFFDLLWFFVPIFSYRMFSKARKYSDAYGYDSTYNEV